MNRIAFYGGVALVVIGVVYWILRPSSPAQKNSIKLPGGFEFDLNTPAFWLIVLGIVLMLISQQFPEGVGPKPPPETQDFQAEIVWSIRALPTIGKLRRDAATIKRRGWHGRPSLERFRASCALSRFSTLLFHALRREELCKLRVKDFRHARKGVPHLKVSGKGGKTRYLPLHPGTHGLINDYLDAAGHGLDDSGALFRPVRNNRTGRMEDAITADGVYRLVRRYSGQLGFLIGAHALRATAATNALDHQADIAKVQEWLGHANIATTRIYEHRRTRPEDSPTFKVAY